MSCDRSSGSLVVCCSSFPRFGSGRHDRILRLGRGSGGGTNHRLGVESRTLKITGSRAQSHRSYAVLSDEGIVLARLGAAPRALIATQERSPDTRRFLCGI
jgi:hypothetical protein